MTTHSMGGHIELKSGELDRKMSGLVLSDIYRRRGGHRLNDPESVAGTHTAGTDGHHRSGGTTSHYKINKMERLKKIFAKNLAESKKSSNFALAKGKQPDVTKARIRRPPGSKLCNDGSMSEWLGTGLQNRSHQFESGWNLKRESSPWT